MNRPIATCLSFAVVLLLQAPAWAELDKWSTHGPFGGEVEALVIDPSNPDVVYAGTWLGGVFKSTDGGRTWSHASDGLATSGLALAVDPRFPETLYAGTFDGVYKTSDGARSWRPLGGLPAETVLTLAVDPVDPDTVYAGVGDDSVYRSTDGGATWLAATAGLEEAIGLYYALAVDPADHRVVYAACGSGVYRSADSGAHWTDVTGDLPSPNGIHSLAIDPRSGLLYAGAFDGVYRSADGGQHWMAPATAIQNDVAALVVDPAVADRLYAGNNDGVVRSDDGGVTWREVNSGLEGYVWSLAIEATGTVYCGTSPLGVLKSSDAGESWSLSNLGLAATFISALAVDPTDSSVVYAGSNDRLLFKTSDGGMSWERIAEPGHVEALAIDPETPSTLYAGTWGTVFRSLDGGLSWTSSEPSDLLDVTSIVLDPADPSTLYAGSFTGAFVSRDGAETWQATGFTDSVLALLIDPTRPYILYAGTSDGVWKTDDRGDTWTWAGKGLPAASGVTTLALDPSRPNILYAGGSFSGLYRSRDEGNHWSRIGSGLPPTNVTALLVDSSLPGRLYAGLFRGGVYLSLDRGDQWRPLDRELASAAVDALVLDPSAPERLYAGTRGRGVFGMTRGLAYVGDRVWVDSDADGRQDGGELGARGVGLRLLDESGTIVATTRSGEAGLYGFGPLETGRYVVALELSPDYRPSPSDQGQDDELDSDFAPGTWRTAPILLEGGERDGSVDAGLIVEPQNVLELQDGRFEVRVDWRDFRGRRGDGRVAVVAGDGPVALRSPDSSTLSFFGPNNWELLFKVLDGRQVNGHFWVFFATATNVAYTVTVTDTSCGTARTYRNPLGVAAPAVTDDKAFVPCASPAPPSCTEGPGVVCLGEGGRFQVRTQWRDFGGGTGFGRQVFLTEPGVARSRSSGLFYFFSPTNWELLLKVLDGCDMNGYFWVFSCATTNVGYTVTVTDKQTGAVRTYENPLGRAADALYDVQAFSCDGN